jgi:hypothetical protein
MVSENTATQNITGPDQLQVSNPGWTTTEQYTLPPPTITFQFPEAAPLSAKGIYAVAIAIIVRIFYLIMFTAKDSLYFNIKLCCLLRTASWIAICVKSLQLSPEITYIFVPLIGTPAFTVVLVALGMIAVYKRSSVCLLIVSESFVLKKSNYRSNF